MTSCYNTMTSSSSFLRQMVENALSKLLLLDRPLSYNLSSGACWTSQSHKTLSRKAGIRKVRC